MNVFANWGYDVWTMDHENYGRSTHRDSTNSDIASGAEDIKAGMQVIVQSTNWGGGTGGTAVECHLLFNVAFFGIMTDLRYDRDKAKRYLKDLYSELNTMYRQNIQFIKRQQNLKPYVYNQPFKASFDRVNDRYKTNISMGNVNTAL